MTACELKKYLNLHFPDGEEVNIYIKGDDNKCRRAKLIFTVQDTKPLFIVEK